MNLLLGVTVFSCTLILGNAFIFPTSETVTHITAFVRYAANFAVNQLNGMSNDAYWYILTNITHATIQPHVGFIYRMDLEMMESQCRNTQSHVNANSTQCPRKSGGHVKSCQVAVTDVTTSNPRYHLTQHKCT